jgi:uncharacterized Zn-binding protein involved in type VI secretion
MHVCPMVTPGVPPIPHVGGPISGPGCPTVLINGMPAAVMGDLAICTGPPDTITLGSTGVLFSGKPAARIGDETAHGGVISLGSPTVLIGETATSSVGGLSNMPITVLVQQLTCMPPEMVPVIAQVISMKLAAQDGAPLAHNAFTCPICSQAT